MNIINMLSRMLMRRALNWGVRKGTTTMTRRGGAAAGGAAKMADGRKVQADSRKNVKRARMAARVARRMMR